MEQVENKTTDNPYLNPKGHDDCLLYSADNFKIDTVYNTSSTFNQT